MLNKPPVFNSKWNYYYQWEKSSFAGNTVNLLSFSQESFFVLLSSLWKHCFMHFITFFQFFKVESNSVPFYSLMTRSESARPMYSKIVYMLTITLPKFFPLPVPHVEYATYMWLIVTSNFTCPKANTVSISNCQTLPLSLLCVHSSLV